jgi:uncharacterized protein (TIGR02246 family)
MNRRWMCAACLILATSVVVGTVRGQGAAVDREGIGHLLSALRAAWDRHDADALAALWAPTGDYVNATGVVAEGQAEVLRLFDDEQKGVMRGTRVGVTLVRARALGDDMAFIDAEVELRGVKAGGREMPPLEHLLAAVVVRSESGWKFLAARLSVPVPAAPSNP